MERRVNRLSDDEPSPGDRALLAALSSHRRGGRPLTADEERLLDSFALGALAGEAEERAAGLVRANVHAAERVLERRLIAAAGHGPAVPDQLARQVLRPAKRLPAAEGGPRVKRRWAWGRWRVSLLGAAAAVLVVLVVAAWPLLRGGEGGRLQVAVLEIADRSALLEPGDLRRRGPDATAGLPDRRYRDVEVPVTLLHGVLAAAGGGLPRDVALRLADFLPPPGSAGPHRVVIDEAARRAAAGRESGTLPLRIYALTDPRSADLRLLAGTPAGAATWLITVRP